MLAKRFQRWLHRRYCRHRTIHRRQHPRLRHFRTRTFRNRDRPDHLSRLQRPECLCRDCRPPRLEKPRSCWTALLAGWLLRGVAGAGAVCADGVAVRAGEGAGVRVGVGEGAATDGRGVDCGVGVGVGGRSSRMTLGPMRTPALSSAGPCGAGVGVGEGAGNENWSGISCAASEVGRAAGIAVQSSSANPRGRGLANRPNSEFRSVCARFMRGIRFRLSSCKGALSHIHPKAAQCGKKPMSSSQIGSNSPASS